MNMKTLVPLVVALALGLVAAVMGKSMMGKGNAAAGGPGMKLTRQVVAREDLAPGATIREADVAVKDVPADAASPHAFAALPDVVGRVVTTQIVKGQAVMNTLLAPAGAAGGLPAMIPEGKRAVTIEVNEVSGLAGLLVPGSRVDLVQTIKVKNADQDLMAKTIVENLQVLAVGRRTSTVAPGAAPGPGGAPEPEQPVARSVTLLATAAEAEAIDLASHVGSPRLVLRNGADKQTTRGKGVTVAHLRGEDEPKSRSDQLTENLLAELIFSNSKPPTPEPAKSEPAKPAAAEAKKVYRDVEVIRGGQSTNVRVGLAPDTAVTNTGANKLFGNAPQQPIDEE
jgi:pilus assembly protein CpaB